MASVTLSGVQKSYGRVQAVKGVDLDIADGEFVVLVGPSGCGKTTLLRLIAGLEEISEGEIAIGDRVVNDVLPRDRDIAMVFQNYALYPYLTVYENVAFGLRARKTPQAEIEREVNAVAEMLGISQLLSRFPRELSGGQRQRVAMGRAVVRRPSLFLFDEPLSNLDAQLRDDVRMEIKALHARLGSTMVYVTHDQLEALTLADRIVLMRDGLVEQVGTPIDLYEQPATRFAASFIGSPQINFVDGTLVEGPAGGPPVFRITDDILVAVPRSLLPRIADRLGQTLAIGMRPEHIHPAGHGSGLAEVAQIRARAGVIQPAGARTYVRFALGAHEVEAEFPSRAGVETGSEAEILIDIQRLIVVDPQSDRVL